MEEVVRCLGTIYWLVGCRVVGSWMASMQREVRRC